MNTPGPLLGSPWLDGLGASVFDTARFVVRFFRELVRPPFHLQEIVHQCHEVGWRSLPLLTLTGLVTGIVFTKQSRPSLEDFGATSWLPSLITIALIRSLAPLSAVQHLLMSRPLSTPPLTLAQPPPMQPQQQPCVCTCSASGGCPPRT